MEPLMLNLSTSNASEKRKRNPESTEDQPSQDVAKKKAKKEVKNTVEDNKEYISSLFNHNPDIPHLDLGSGQPSKTEAVFSAKSLDEGGVHAYIAKTLAGLGMESLTRVQSMALPLIAAGMDCLIKSQTGSGKTLAYAIPMVQQLAAIRPKIQRSQGTFAIVVCPTRELVVQSYEWFQKLCHSFAWLVPGMLIGGEKRKSEKARVRKGITILIATPGRLIDHITHTKCLSLKNVKWLVLDECDRTLELGYKRDVQTVVTAINEQGDGQRQTLLLSATLTQGIEEMSSISMKHPKFVDAAVDDVEQESLTTLTTPDNLVQTFVIVPAKLRLVVLASFILWKSRFSRARKLLVFMSTQDMIDFHAELFDRCLNSGADDHNDNLADVANLTEDAKKMISGEKTVAKPQQRDIKLLKLHGSMEQKDRLKILDQVRTLPDCVLLCTDVAARGLDLPLVDWIVQYNPPTTTADYVHRVGRTARIGAKGSSLLFVLPSEANFVKDLETHNMSLAELTVDRILEKLFHNSEPSRKTGRLPNTMEEAATNLQMNLENAVANDKGMHEAASQAYTSFVRSYASYPREARHIFSFKALHLGHIAKSYALRDPPTKITGLGKGHWVKKEAMKKKDSLKREQHVIRAQEKRINQKSLVMSEFASGFDGISTVEKIPSRSKTVRKKKKKLSKK